MSPTCSTGKRSVRYWPGGSRDEVEARGGRPPCGCARRSSPCQSGGPTYSADVSDFSPPPPPSDPPPPPPPMGPPPGYVAYGGPGDAGRRFSASAAWPRPSSCSLADLHPARLIGIAATVRLAHKARDFLDGDISAESLPRTPPASGSNLGGLLVFAIAPLTMIWMFRMARNVRILGRPGLKFAPGWAIGGWFTPPLVLYVVPWLMFRELWKASEPGLAPGDEQLARRRRSRRSSTSGGCCSASCR